MRQFEIDDAALAIRCAIAKADYAEVKDPATAAEAPAVPDFDARVIRACSELAGFAFDSRVPGAEALADRIMGSAAQILGLQYLPEWDIVPEVGPLIEVEWVPEPEPKPKKAPKKTARKASKRSK